MNKRVWKHIKQVLSVVIVIELIFTMVLGGTCVKAEERSGSETVLTEIEETGTNLTETGESEITPTVTVTPEATPTVTVTPEATPTVTVNPEVTSTVSLPLSEEELQIKEKQKEILADARQMVADEDYREHNLLFFADTKEEAQEVADRLGATLVDYEFKSANLTFDKTVVDLLQEVVDSMESYPLLYVNHMYKMQESDSVSDEILMEQASTAEGEAYASAEAYSSAVNYNDPGLQSQWHHKYLGTRYAWNKGYTGSGVTVAVLDTGVCNNHPDLNVSQYIDSMGAYSEGTPYDTNGHGTCAAGVIASIANNKIGGVGIAPGVTLISCKVATINCIFYDDTIMKGIYDAVDQGADVISISCAFSKDSYGYLSRGIAYAVEHSCVVVASAGNGDTNSSCYLPAHEDVIGVGSLNQSGVRISNSNYGPNVDIMAPGTSIYTTANGGGYTDGFGATSAAAPVVAGAAVIAICSDPDLLATAVDGTGSKTGKTFVTTVQQKLYDSAKANSDTEHYGHGNLNITELVGYYTVDPVIEADSSANGSIISNTTKITITTPRPADAIYYTLNGATPTTTTGILYEGPFSIEKSGKVTVSAIAVKDGEKGKTVSQTYTVTVFVDNLELTTSAPLISNDRYGLTVGKAITFKAIPNPSNATNKAVTWSTSNAGVATVAAGKVVGKSVGDVVITATAIGGAGGSSVGVSKDVHVYAATTKVEITPSIALTIEGQDNGTILYGSQQIMVSSVPEGTMEKYTYRSANPKIASVDENGMVTAVGSGNTTVTATATDGTSKKAVCNVSVTVPVKEVTITSKNAWYDENQAAYIVGKGKSLEFTPVFVPTVPTNKKVTWSTNNASIVVKNGVVTGKAITEFPAEFTIASNDNPEASAVNRVSVYPLTTKIKLDEKKMTIAYQETAELLTATVEPGNAYADSFLIQSSNPKVLTVDPENGTMYGLAPGTASVKYTARDGSGKSTMVSVTVSTDIPKNVQASRVSASKAHVSWDVLKTGADLNYEGYVVYRSTSLKGSYKAISSVITEHEYVDNSMKSGNYYYKIKAAISVPNGTRSKIVYGSFSEAANVQILPDQVTGLLATAEGFTGVLLEWSTVSEADGYVIMCSETADGAYKKIATLKGNSTTSYTDNRGKGQTTYYYQVQAYRSSTSALGALSEAKSVMTGSNTVYLNGLSATATGDNQIKLTWTAIPGATSYQIYRSLEPGVQGTVYKTVKTNAYTDSVNSKYADFDKQIYYRVCAASAMGAQSTVAAVDLNRIMTPKAVHTKTSGNMVTFTITHPGTSNAIKGIQCYVGSTEAEARSKANSYMSYIIFMNRTMPKSISWKIPFDTSGTYYVVFCSEAYTDYDGPWGFPQLAESRLSNTICINIP